MIHASPTSLILFPTYSSCFNLLKFQSLTSWFQETVELSLDTLSLCCSPETLPGSNLRHKVHLICFSSPRDHWGVLPIVNYMKTIVLYIFPVLFFFLRQKFPFISLGSGSPIGYHFIFVLKMVKLRHKEVE